jgi:hypothetical protein
MKLLRDAGVTLVVGSDSGKWPLEILRAATVNPATMLALADPRGVWRARQTGG